MELAPNVGGTNVTLVGEYRYRIYMTGDYISRPIAFNRAVTVVPVAQAPNGQHFLNTWMERAFG